MKRSPGSGGLGGSLLARSGRRHWQRHPWQAALAVAGIAMGVAMAVAVDLASQSARTSYQWSAETLAGRATHHVQGLTGSLADSVYARLRLAGLRDRSGNPIPMTPVLEAQARISGDLYRLVGLDPFSFRELGAFGLSEAPMGGVGSGDEDRGGPVPDMASLISRPGAVLLSRPAAARLGVGAGDSMAIEVENRTLPAVALGILEPRNRLAETLVDRLLICDMSTAQEMTGRNGRLSRIELDLTGAGTSAAPEAGLPGAVQAMLPPEAQLTGADARARTLDSMTRAFRINLAALSLLAMVVGAFLIYNTMAFSVARRWSLFGALRSLGARPGDIAGLVFREAAVLSLAGALLGILGGILLGRGLVAMVARTLNDLYFSAQMSGLRLEPAILIKGGLLGVGMGLLASVGPAWQAARIRPRVLLTRSAQETALRRRLPLLNALGLALAVSAVVLARLPAGGLVAGFASLAAAVFSWALWTPFMLGFVSRAGAAVLGSLPGALGMLGRMAARGAGASLSRTGVAAAALMTALSVTVAMGIMVDSFRRAVSDWLEAVLIADFYVSPPARGSGRPQGNLDSGWVARARALPGVAGATTYLAATIRLPDSGQVHVIALELDPRGRAAFRFLEGGGTMAWTAFGGPACAALLSEPLAYRRGLHPGDSLRLPSRQGTRSFPVAGVFSDYGSDQGIVMLERTCFESHWLDRGFTSLAVFAADSASRDSLARRLAGLPGSENVEIRPNRALREASLEIFDRTFAITSVMRLAAVIVALAGLIGALAALALERAPETALLRALGLTPLQTWGLETAQAAFLGAATGLLAIPLGLAQAYLLIHIINRRSFGWTIPMQADPWICAQAVLLGLGAALLAAVLPAWKITRTVTARALREE